MPTLFVKTTSKVVARYKLSMAKQGAELNLESFRREIERLARECNFVQVLTAQVSEQMMLQTFATGRFSTKVQRRLLEQKKLNFAGAYKLTVVQVVGIKEASLCDRPVTLKVLKLMVASTSEELFR